MRKKIILVPAVLTAVSLALMPVAGCATEEEGIEQPPELVEELWTEPESYEQPPEPIEELWTEPESNEQPPEPVEEPWTKPVEELWTEPESYEQLPEPNGWEWPGESWGQEVTPEPVPEPTPEPTPVPMFEIDGDVLRGYYAHGENRSVTVPDGVRVIGRDAFRGDYTLEVVILPDSLEEIQDRAFADCVRLREIKISSGSALRVIWDQAFLNCRSLDISFSTSVPMVAGNAFEGVIVDIPDPVPVETPMPTDNPPQTVEPVPEEPDIPIPAEEPTAEPVPEEPDIPMPVEEPTEETPQIPEPTAEPVQEVISEPESDPYEDIEWEDTTPVQSSSGAGSGKRQTHGRSKMTSAEMHDYDQVKIDLNGQAESQPMHTLTMNGQELELTLDNASGESRNFTYSLYDWTDAKMAENSEGDTLILRAAEDDANEAEEELCWRINGAALRKLNKSGISYLVFQQGENLTAIPTEGFLAGWAYDELKSRGTAGRRFDYTLSTGEEPQWTVEVEGAKYELGEDPLTSIYLTGVENGTEVMLKTAKEE